jgi:hypothetical protein
VCRVLQDGEIRKLFQRTLTKQGFKWKLGMKVLQQLFDDSLRAAAAELQSACNTQAPASLCCG